MREFVYFIRIEAPTENRPVKVGRARDVGKRRRDLQCSSPWPLVTLRTIEGSLGLEGALHRFLAVDRMHGEWFRPSARLDALLAMSDEEIHNRLGRVLPEFPLFGELSEPRGLDDGAAWLADVQRRLADLRAELAEIKA